ncbi:MAG: pirin family protein, partial [Myxococcales bacterium]|nr:pirin family protein [Myxococcales bacterium]
FSFADYYDPKFVGFRSLRVINDDRVAPGRGFPAHPHRNMEIITYVLEGATEHKDSMGNVSIIRPGDVQRMSAGTGVTHSEFNPQDDAYLHLLQIWIRPDRAGHTPGYEQKAFNDEEKRGKLRLVASPDGADGSVTIHQDTKIYAGLFDKGESATLTIAEGRGAWVHVARGSVRVNGEVLEAGDGAAFSESGMIRVEGTSGGEVLAFDLI